MTEFHCVDCSVSTC